MNRILLALLLPVTVFANNPKNTYEQIRDQLAEEADERVQAVQNGFAQEYRPLIVRLGLSSFLTGAFLPLTVNALQRNDTRLACLYSALTTFFGSYTFLKHSELAENRRVLHEEMFTADRVYQNKMGHIHTRHYMNDIAKFIVAGLDEIAQKYLTAHDESVDSEKEDNSIVQEKE